MQKHSLRGSLLRRTGVTRFSTSVASFSGTDFRKSSRIAIPSLVYSAFRFDLLLNFASSFGIPIFSNRIAGSLKCRQWLEDRVHLTEYMRRQGHHLTEPQKSRITQLLIETDLALADIARRVGCGKSAVTMFNRKHGIRQYDGKRSHWTVADQWVTKAG